LIIEFAVKRIGSEKMDRSRVSEENTNTIVTLAHDDGKMKASVRLSKLDIKCDSKTSVKIEPVVLDIQIGQAGGRGDMDPDSYR
jgi:hypothetical protein